MLDQFSVFAEAVTEMAIRSEGQESLFTRHESFVQRVLALSASCMSIVFCLIAMYLFFAIDSKRLVFRHQLIFFLLFFDLVKACILLLYPSRVLTHYTAYYNDRFCQIVGFFTATAIEGADIAILSFAIHTFLLIFKPLLTVKVKNSERTEGGLYIYRFYVYALSFFIPIILASLAFIKSDGYLPYVCWCYLPQRPVWPRVVLSWVPRYIIIVIIFLVYGLIYMHVIKEFKTLGGVFTTIHKLRMKGGIYPSSLNDKPSFYSALRFFFLAVRDHIFPKFVLPEDTELKETSSTPSNIDPIVSHLRRLENKNVDTDVILNDPEIQAQNLNNFRNRQKVIEKQMKSIFIYPFAYCFVWLFPFILQCTQFNYEEEHGPIYWLNCMGAFMQPLNGFVDSLVFFYRERPWEHTIMKNFEKEHETTMDGLVTSGTSVFPNSVAYTSASFHQDSVSTAGRMKNSINASLSVDLNQYPKWRRRMAQLHLPLMKLPTEENITNFQVRYLSNKLANIRRTQRTQGSMAHSTKIKKRDTARSKHDFSTILAGDIAEKDFRSTLEKFSLNFGQGRRSSMSSLTPKDDVPERTGTMKSKKHVADPNEPVIFEGKPYQATPTDSPQNPEVQRPHSQVFANTTAANTISLLNSLQQQRRQTGTGVSALDSPISLTTNASNPSTPKRYNTKPPQSQRSDNSTAVDTSDTEDDMDFLEFLRKGP